MYIIFYLLKLSLIIVYEDYSREVASTKNSSVARCSLLLRILKVYRTGIHSGYIQYTYREFHIPHRILLRRWLTLPRMPTLIRSTTLSAITYAAVLTLHLSELFWHDATDDPHRWILSVPDADKILVNFQIEIVQRKRSVITLVSPQTML